MITDEDRAKIVERILAEQEIRNDLAKNEAEEKTKTNSWSWIESKFGLLIIGAILSGVLIPVFQSTQETIKWARQNRYDNLNYRIESVRSAMRELTVVHTFVPEALERMRMVGVDGLVDDKDREGYKARIVEMHSRRFQQNAKFVGAIGLLDEKDRETVRHKFSEYLSAVQQLMNVFEKMAHLKMKSTSNRNDNDLEVLVEAKSSLDEDVDKLYEKTLDTLKNYLHRLEAKSEKYF